MANVRAAALTNFDLVARFVGLDPCALLLAAGLDSAAPDEQDRPLPIAPVARLLDDAADLSGREDFGLLMAESRSLASLGPVSLVLMHQPLVSDIIRALVRYQHLFGDAIQIRDEMIGETMLVRIELAGVPFARQANELVVAYFCRCIGAVLGRTWNPECVHFRHSAPKSLAAHWRVLSCPVYFDSEFNAILCAREAMRERNPASDRELAVHAERMLALIRPIPGVVDVTERARRLLRLLLPDQRGSLEEVARNMAMTPRSLQRALAREGQSFGALQNEVRRELATRYLAASHPIGVAAALTGFERANSFTRWFSGEFGLPPAKWRQSLGRA